MNELPSVLLNIAYYLRDLIAGSCACGQISGATTDEAWVQQVKPYMLNSL